MKTRRYEGTKARRRGPHRSEENCIRRFQATADHEESTAAHITQVLSTPGTSQHAVQTYACQSGKYALCGRSTAKRLGLMIVNCPPSLFFPSFLSDMNGDMAHTNFIDLSIVAL